MSRPDFMEFIFQNWKLIKKVWYGGPNADTTDYLFEEENWSCFFVPFLLFDIYGEYDEQRERGIFPEKIPDARTLREIFMPGHIYNFGILDHNFTVIYEAPGHFWYSDYYEETNRPNRFRLEKMSLETILSYLEDYIRRDLSSHWGFHQGDEEYVRRYSEEFNSNRDKEYSVLEFCRAPISFQPTVSSVLQT